MTGFVLWPILWPQMGKVCPAKGARMGEKPTRRADDRGLFKRGNRWWLRVYVRGKGRQVLPLRPPGETRATTNRDTARALAADIRRELREHGQPLAAPGTRDPEALIQQFERVNAVEGSAAHAADNARHVRIFVEEMELRSPAEFTAAAVQEHFSRLHARGLAGKTIWNHRASLSKFAEFLIDRGHLPTNPCRRVKVGKLEKLLPRFLSADEYAQVLDLAAKHGIYAEVATALYTGMRREELRRMVWGDVDWRGGVVRVPVSKGKRPRAIPMSEKLREVLTAQREKAGDRAHVFPGRLRKGQSGMRRGSWWNDAMKPLQAAMPAAFTEGMAAQATGRGWHLFRHTFASRLVQAGVPIAKVSAWLGHTDIRTTMIYSHLAPGHDEDIEKV